MGKMIMNTVSTEISIFKETQSWSKESLIPSRWSLCETCWKEKLSLMPISYLGRWKYQSESVGKPLDPELESPTGRRRKRKTAN